MTILEKLFNYKSMLFTLLFVLSLSSVQSQSISTIEGENIGSQKLTENIRKIMKEEAIPGLSIAIINDNEVIYHEAFGVSNAQTKEPVDKKSIFEGASLSKPIFAYFVMKMVENGKIDLDKPLYTYLPHPGIAPEFMESAKLITPRMVLSHQTGFPNHAMGDQIRLAFTPGEGFMYSGEAYQYLAAIIGMQHGIGWKSDLNALFQKSVTEPLQMKHTTFVWDDYLAQHKVFGHNSEGKPTANQPKPGYWDGTTFNAFSSVHSEAGEYAKFIVAMLKQEGLKRESFQEMLKEQTHFDADNPLRKERGQTGWGLGFAQKKTHEGTMHLHTGNNHDFQAYAMFIPEKEYGLVVFTNSDKMVHFLEGISEILGPQF